MVSTALVDRPEGLTESPVKRSDKDSMFRNITEGFPRRASNMCGCKHQRGLALPDANSHKIQPRQCYSCSGNRFQDILVRLSWVFKQQCVLPSLPPERCKAQQKLDIRHHQTPRNGGRTSNSRETVEMDEMMIRSTSDHLPSLQLRLRLRKLRQSTCCCELTHSTLRLIVLATLSWTPPKRSESLNCIPSCWLALLQFYNLKEKKRNKPCQTALQEPYKYNKKHSDQHVYIYILFI